VQIRFILLQNRQGRTRLAKYYVPLDDKEKRKLEVDIHRLVVNQDAKATNFLEFRTYKVIYRRYAGLFFSMCVDTEGAPRWRARGAAAELRPASPENELACLETMHLFVEVLDTYFSHVCELDLVWHFHKVYMILDEFILAGEIQETSKKVILERLEASEARDSSRAGRVGHSSIFVSKSGTYTYI
jgi:AP-2 complex subunit sigma-1